MTSSALLALHLRKILSSVLAQQSAPSKLSLVQRDFVLQSPIGNPFFSWPRTLLSYAVKSSDESPDLSRYKLLCIETGEVVPFQVSKSPKPSNGKDSQAQFLFCSDLPSASTRTYRLTPTTSDTIESSQNQIKITHEEHRLMIDTGPMQIRIPASQDITSGAPGPIMEVARGGRWTGLSTLKITDHPIASILTEELEAGPLRSAHRITYTTNSGFKYVATIECMAGVDFVRLHENMEAIPVGVYGEFDFAWSNCDFAYRQSPNHPYHFPSTAKTEYTDYPWEAIAPKHIDTQFGVAPGIASTGKLPFSLRLFEPWQDVAAASFANFWSDNSPDAAAIFIDHVEQWEDHEYAIWHSSSRIAVEFIYSKPALHFVWKIARGTRSTCISFYDHAKDIDSMKKLEQQSKGVESDGTIYPTGLFPTSYALELQNWHGTLSLNKTKDWMLFYPSSAGSPKPLFRNVPWKSALEFNKTITESEFVTQLALSGVRQNHGFGPTSSRRLLDSWVPGYQVFRSQLTQSQQRRVEAILLLLAYVHAGEDYMPMQRMLSGHPNFLSDVKSTPPGITFLFPDHPTAETWADEWEAYLHLNTRYHIRPTVEAWNARGGRWTENLGTYVWAFLRPALRASFLLKCRDGSERLCTPQISSLGEWLVNALSAPFDGETPDMMKQITEASARNEGAKRHYWGIVSPTDAPRRVHPPLGAHSERRKTPRMMWYMGTALRNYSPLTAEHLMWASRPTDQDMELPMDDVDPYAVMYTQPDNRGTNPHLRTAKYTGYGITLRAAVDTPQELSIHLMQIDDGPNYRWGYASEGSCGMVYFYANGKGYSHNGTEDAGDRIDQDTDFGTNFGVWKDGAFRSIGQNVLSRPFYALEFAQFAEIVPRGGSNAYSWPEYVSRSVLLAGDDYFILQDKVFNPEVAHRFSWFVRKGDDFPHITLLSGAQKDKESSRFTSVETENMQGRWADGMGDSIALITHKEGIRAEPAAFGGRVYLHDGNDLVFAAPKTIEFREDKKAFIGTSGIIRSRNDGWEIALFHGTHISVADISFTTSDADLGISAKMSKSGTVFGYYFAPLASEIEVDLPRHSENLVFFIDAQKANDSQCASHITVKLPAGAHRWELTAGLPVPLAPIVNRAEYLDAGVVVHGISVAATTSYEIEVSSDDAKSWKTFGTATEPVFTLSGLTNGMKYHVRLFARNAEHMSAPGPEYPVYITRQPPSPPDGLYVELRSGSANLSWGKVVGTTEYRLYRKRKEETKFHVIYVGLATTWKDVDPAIIPPASSPTDTTHCSKTDPAACEYRVTSVNHNGESRPSRTSSTDSTSWRNWNPTVGEPFRRTTELTSGLRNVSKEHYYPK